MSPFGFRCSPSLATLAITALMGTGGCNPVPQDELEAQALALASVTGAEIRSHMGVLAGDELQGREAGTGSYLQAAHYVAGRFQASGLVPLGDDGTYMQNIRFLETRLIAGSASMTLRQGSTDTALAFGKEFLRSGSFGSRDETIAAPLVFVGFGIRAPEYGHDDFSGVDVKGKIMVVLSGAPARFKNDERAFYSSAAGKEALAVELGALGVITVRTPVDQQRLPWSSLESASASSSMRWLKSDGTPHESFSELAGNALLSESGAVRLFALAGRDLHDLFEKHGAGATGGFDLDISATLRRRSEQQTTTSPNVIGMIRGSDPKLRHEYIIYTAHLDHLGIRPGTGEDDIHNGAYDNAAGVAAVLEVVDAVSRMKPAPRRSILFAAVTAEEKGLLGSDYLAHHPPVPIASLVANINIDMPYLGFPVADVEGFGVEHSTLHDALRRASARLGVALTPDPRPDLVRLIRSDQFSFVKQGVPGLNLKAGSRSSDSAIDGAAMRDEYLRVHYHRPGDDLGLAFSHEGAARFVRVALLLGLTVAEDRDPPRWLDGDFFGARFDRLRSNSGGVAVVAPKKPGKFPTMTKHFIL